jgi:hypothetical protein
MIALISTHFDCTAQELWEKISQPQSLQFVSSPLLRFKPLEKGALDDEWTVGKTYALKLYFLNLVPFGRHNIKLVTIDKASNTIESHENGTLAPVWNHTIRFRQVEPGRLHYTDEIEIQAGWRTVAVWAFAHLFYRYRQRRWKKLLQ